MKKLWVIFVLGNLFLAMVGVSPVRAEVPRIVNYQGKLTDALGAPVNSETELSFSVYTEASGGWAIWSEAQTVKVTEGIFNVLLGVVSPLEPDYFSGLTYLGIRVGSDSEMMPRQKIASGAYALRAELSQRADVSEVAEDLSIAGRASLIDIIYPIGSIYISSVATNPATLFGVGTWGAFGEGRVPVGKASSGTFAAAGATGGAETHTLTSAEMPAHIHRIKSIRDISGTDSGGNWIKANNGQGNNTGYAPLGSEGIESTGGNAAHNNLPPYIVVYMWKRTG